MSKQEFTKDFNFGTYKTVAGNDDLYPLIKREVDTWYNNLKKVYEMDNCVYLEILDQHKIPESGPFVVRAIAHGERRCNT